MLMTRFNACVVLDYVPPQVAHRAFLAIDDYRLAISPDQLGAEDGEGPLNKPWKKSVADRMDHASSPQRPAPRR